MNRFRDALAKGDEFVVTCELVPPRGYLGKGIDRILEFAESAAVSDRIHAVSITDNAGGNPAFSADSLCVEIKEMGKDPLVHFSCKDMNRNALESRAYALQRAGVHNLLVLTGDYPTAGFMGRSKPVFDGDSITALHHMKSMNDGLEDKVGRKTVKVAPTDFFLGAAASPFKWTEASSVMQYYKLEKKLRAGAEFIITQLGYDSRKFNEMYQYVRAYLGLSTRLIGSVYILSAGAARFMNKGEVPGSYVTDHLVEILTEESKADDKGRTARLERAARQIAILRGIGYSGVHIEGLNLKYPDVMQILEREEEIRINWKEYLAEFNHAPKTQYYVFTRGSEFQVIGSDEEPVLNVTKKRRILNPNFWLTRLVHKLLFVQGTVGFGMMRAFMRFLEHRPKLKRPFDFIERLYKTVAFDCRHCADCTLFDTYYLCPESKCPKGTRNGPCGGSRPDGHCVVFPDRFCMWERVYWRAKNRDELQKLKTIMIPRDWQLYETSSWANYYLGYDHSSRKLRIPDEVGAEKPEG